MFTPSYYVYYKVLFIILETLSWFIKVAVRLFVYFCAVPLNLLSVPDFTICLDVLIKIKLNTGNTTSHRISLLWYYVFRLAKT